MHSLLLILALAAPFVVVGAVITLLIVIIGNVTKSR
jgi:hypothetical protein